MLLPLSYYLVSGIVNFFTSAFISFVVWHKNPKSNINRVFSLFAFAVAFWSFFYFIWLVSPNFLLADFFIRTCMIGVLLMPPIFTHFTLLLLQIKINKNLVAINYLLGLFFVLTVYTPLYANPGGPFLIIPYWPLTGPVFHLTIVYFFVNVIISHYLLAKNMERNSGNSRIQLLYVFLGTSIGYIGGSTNFFSWYRIPIPPFLNILVSAYVIIIAYAITKTRLMDIRVVIGKTFAHLITILLFAAGYLALTFGYLNSSAGLFGWPFVLLSICYSVLVGELFDKIRQHIQTPVDRFFIKNQYDFPDVTRIIATKFRRSLTHADIIRNIYPILTNTVDIQAVRFFFLGTGDTMEEWNTDTQTVIPDSILPASDPLTKEVLLKRDIVKIPKESGIKGELAIPVLTEDNILSMIVVGKKRSEDDYSEQDFDLFKTIADYIGIALEFIIKPYEEVQRQFEISEKKLVQTERELYRSQRLASIGTLTAGVTHEIRNPLGIIRSGLEILPKQTRDQKYLNEFRDKYVKYVDRIEGIVEKVLGLAREEKNKTIKEVDLNAIIRETLGLLQIDDNIKTEKELDPSLPIIKGVPEDIERVFINLFENAKHAMTPNGGLLKIKTYLLEKDDEPNKKAVIEISDTGIGIPKKNIEKIFDPFFSSRHEGTGLGLSIVFRIIKEHGGDIDVKSEEGKGTVFTVSFNVEN